MKTLITGADSILGIYLIPRLEKAGHTITKYNNGEIDLTSYDLVKDLLKNTDFELIIHLDEYSRIDEAEDNKEECFHKNVDSTMYLSMYAQIKDIEFLYLSNFNVFEGKLDLKSNYLVSDERKPINHYGHTKLLAEEEASSVEKLYVIRTGWLYGKDTNNFVNNMVKLSELKDTIAVVNDQYGNPTFADDVAELIVKIIKSKKYGTYHVASSEKCNYVEFATEIFKIINKDINIIEMKTKEYNNKSERPINGSLDKKSLIMEGFNELPKWKESLKKYLLSE